MWSRRCIYDVTESNFNPSATSSKLAAFYKPCFVGCSHIFVSEYNKFCLSSFIYWFPGLNIVTRRQQWPSLRTIFLYPSPSPSLSISLFYFSAFLPCCYWKSLVISTFLTMSCKHCMWSFPSQSLEPFRKDYRMFEIYRKVCSEHTRKT
jgi:hypothetical protein